MDEHKAQVREWADRLALKAMAPSYAITAWQLKTSIAAQYLLHVRAAREKAATAGGNWTDYLEPEGFGFFVVDPIDLIVMIEPPRVDRRLHPLRGWGHEKFNTVFGRGKAACSSDGHGAHTGPWVTMGRDPVYFREDRMYG